MKFRLSATLLCAALSVVSAPASAESGRETFSIYADPEKTDAGQLQAGDQFNLYFIYKGKTWMFLRGIPISRISWSDGEKVLTFTLNAQDAESLSYAIHRGAFVIERTSTEPPNLFGLFRDYNNRPPPPELKKARPFNPLFRREIP
ncbi:MAG: hypothetical protein AAGH74_05220 [Pseudomonadota bacterium]